MSSPFTRARRTARGLAPALLPIVSLVAAAPMARAQDPTVQFALATQQVAEGGGALFIECLLSAPHTQQVEVPFALSGAATIPADFTLSPTRAIFPPGATSAGVTATIVSDALY